MTDVTTGEAGEPGLSRLAPGDRLGVLVDRRRGGDWGCVPPSASSVPGMLVLHDHDCLSLLDFNATHGYKDKVPGKRLLFFEMFLFILVSAAPIR